MFSTTFPKKSLEKREKSLGVSAMAKDEMCKNVVEIRKVSNRVMTAMFSFEEEVLRLT